MTFAVDLGKAPAPSRSYSAETCTIQVRGTEVHFVFGQYSLVGDQLESAIAIRMHGYFAKRFLASVRQMSAPGLDEIAREMDISGEEVNVLTENPKHLAKLSGNIIQASVSGYETTLDFYQVSPSAVVKAKVRGESAAVDLLPVVRVDLRTSLFMGLVGELTRLEPQFPSGNDAQGGMIYESNR